MGWGKRTIRWIVAGALVACSCTEALGAPAVARVPFEGTGHSITQNPDGTFDVLLVSTVITQPTTFTVIGAATDRLNLVEVQAGVPQLIFVNIIGSSNGRVESVNQIDMGASTSTVLVNDLRTWQDVGSIFVNTIVSATIGGDVTGGITLLERTNGGSSTLIGATVQGSILGDVVVDHGDIIALNVVGTIGAPGSPVQVRTSGHIVDLSASEMHADITTLSGGGAGGLVSELRTTSGGLAGSLSMRGLGATEPGSISLISIAGDLDADVLITEDVENDNGGLPVFVVGGEFTDGREMEIGRSLLAGAEIRIASNSGLGGQILINALDQGGAWSGHVRIGGSLLGPVPMYSATSGALGGGAVGLAPFRQHLADSAPGAGSVLDQSIAPTLASPVILRHYGPVTWETLDSALVVERRAIGSGGAWTDVTSCMLVGRPGGESASPNALSISPINPLPSGFTYQIRPVVAGANRLQSDLGLQTNPPAATPVTPYSFSVVGGCAGDANSDALVNFSDVTSVLANWSSPDLCSTQGDANLDGQINFADITSVLANWGTNCNGAVSVAPIGRERRALARAAGAMGFASVDSLEAWIDELGGTDELRERLVELGEVLAGGEARVTQAGVEE